MILIKGRRGTHSDTEDGFCSYEYLINTFTVFDLAVNQNHNVHNNKNRAVIFLLLKLIVITLIWHAYLSLCE